MKEKTLYVCEICGVSYSNKKMCQQCESSHKKPVKIEKCKYLPLNDNAKGYPHKIEVKMEDGTIVQYHR